jgi:hypothetical protein
LGGSLDEQAVRRAMVGLARFACRDDLDKRGRQKGDHVFERVTEGRQGCWLISGRRRCYSACGDLPHFVMWAACGAIQYTGDVRKSLRWINRAEAWGWRVQWNLIKLHAETGSAWSKHVKGDAVVERTQPGDVWIIGDGQDQHAMVIASIVNGVIKSYDYGQFFNGADGIGRAGGNVVVRRLHKGRDGRTWVFKNRAPGRPLYGRLNTYAAMLHADMAKGEPGALDAALVPSDCFKLGIPSDNPYFETYGL